MNQMGDGYFIHFAKLDKAYRKMCFQAVEEYHFSPSEIVVLMFLSNNVTMDSASDIARYKNISKGLVAKSVDSLSKKGFLSSEKDPDDRRMIHLKLTEESADIVNRLQICRNVFTEKLIKGIPKEYLNILEQTTEMMENNLNTMVKGRE